MRCACFTEKSRYNWTNWTRYDELHKIFNANSSNVDLFMGSSQNDCTLTDKLHVITTNKNNCGMGMNRAFQTVFFVWIYFLSTYLMHAMKCACAILFPILFIDKWQNYFLFEFNLLLEFISHFPVLSRAPWLARPFSCDANLFHCINGNNTILHSFVKIVRYNQINWQ